MFGWGVVVSGFGGDGFFFGGSEILEVKVVEGVFEFNLEL